MISSRALSIPLLLFALAPAFAQEPVQIDMGGISIIGDQELPNVLYVVPWKDPAPVSAAAPESQRGGGMLPEQLKRHVMQRQLRHRAGQTGDANID